MEPPSDDERNVLYDLQRIWKGHVTRIRFDHYASDAHAEQWEDRADVILPKEIRPYTLLNVNRIVAQLQPIGDEVRTSIVDCGNGVGFSTRQTFTVRSPIDNSERRIEFCTVLHDLSMYNPRWWYTFLVQLHE